MDQEHANSSGFKNFIPLLWIASLVVVAFFAYGIGKENNTPQDQLAINATSNNTSPQVTEITPTPEADITAICKKTGISQKKDYLASYTIKPNDTTASIAIEQLGNASRETEIVQLNSNVSSLSIGSTLYLPPTSIKQSAGNISEVSGMLVAKDNANWQLSFGGGAKGPGLLLPTYWFQDVADKDSYKIGECLTILFDNGIKVFTITKR